MKLLRNVFIMLIAIIAIFFLLKNLSGFFPESNEEMNALSIAESGLVYSRSNLDKFLTMYPEKKVTQKYNMSMGYFEITAKLNSDCKTVSVRSVGHCGKHIKTLYAQYDKTDTITNSGNALIQ